MSQIIELPDPIYGALQQAAQAAGTTPEGWIAARLAETGPVVQLENGADHPPPKTMADLFAGHVGRFHSGKGNLSENCGERFTDYLEAKRREGRL